MKKRSVIILLLLVVIVILSVTLLNKNLRNSSSNDFKGIKSSSYDISFAVISDIHDNTDNLSDAINDLYSINSSMDALVLNGDSVDQGKDEQYNEVKGILQKNSNKLPDIIIKNIGNHEYYDYSKDDVSDSDVKSVIQKYLDFSGYDSIYHDEWIKGYHFISLGSDNTGKEKVNYTSGCISDEQIEWLKNTISEGYIEGKPIFVFLHQPIDMQFFNLDVTGIDKNDELKEILSKYQEVILFTSHTHTTPDEDIDKQKSITAVNTGSVNSNYVTDQESERGFKEDKSYSNGIYVEVHGNSVTVTGIDFKNNSVLYTRSIF